MNEVVNDPRRLSQVVLRIAAELGLYNAELARILRTDCPEVGALASGRQHLQPETQAWTQACLLLRCYRALCHVQQGDEVAMYHWLHVHHAALDGTPHRLLVDEQRLADVVDLLEARVALLTDG